MSKPAYSDKLQAVAIGYCDGAINLYKCVVWNAIHLARENPGMTDEEIFEKSCEQAYEPVRFTAELFSDIEEGPDDAE